ELANSVAINQRTKHIDVRYHAIRDFILDNKLILVDTDTTENLADLFTKSLKFKQIS
ncbi:hypothetical protein HK097_005298, partial [Rhizophlyctis rosea]